MKIRTMSLIAIIVAQMVSIGPSGDITNPSPVKIVETATYLPPSPVVLYLAREHGVSDSIAIAISRAIDDSGVDERLALAMITVESNWVVGAVSNKGAVGLMQLMTSTYVWINDGRIKGIYDPYNNVLTGCKYIQTLIEKFKGDTTLALAYYNGGGRVAYLWDKNYKKVPHETSNYIKKIKEIM